MYYRSGKNIKGQMGDGNGDNLNETGVGICDEISIFYYHIRKIEFSFFNCVGLSLTLNSFRKVYIITT